MVQQRIRPALEQPLPQPRAMPAAVEGRIRHQLRLSFAQVIGKRAGLAHHHDGCGTPATMIG
jgi:hypothetical protein